MKQFFLKYYFLLCSISIAIVSFFLFAPIYSNGYSSDNAIHVLMAYDFEFPTDLYYWGQDRLGSLIPMLAAIPVKLFGWSPIW